MSYDIEAIRNSCPAVLKKLVDGEELIPILEVDEWDANLGKARCNIPTDTRIEAKVPFGCRGVTSVSSTGCPLRDGNLVSVSLSEN